MKQMPAAKFKEQCLALLDEVDEEGSSSRSAGSLWPS
jgi:hypothetical protein